MARTHVTIEEHELLRRHFNAGTRRARGPGAFDRVTKQAGDSATDADRGPASASSPQDTGKIGLPPF
jgi:hypothetical protein